MEQHPETVVEHTINAMRDAIRDGRFAPGQRLVVAEVTKKLGVSAGPVREAVRRLTGEGLVEITPHVGATVRQFGAKDVREIFQLREAVEGLAAKLAAEAGETRRELAGMLEAARRLLAGGGEGYVGHNHDFHELIYRLAGNDRLREMAAQLTLPIYRLRFHYLMDPAYIRVSAQEHELIAEAILGGDGVRAERMMRNHIRNSGAALLEALEDSRAERKPERARRA